MKLKEGYILREVAGNNVIIPVGDARTKFNGVMTLSSTGAFLWRILENGAESEKELADAILSEYEIDEATARTDVHSFVEKAYAKGLLE